MSLTVETGLVVGGVVGADVYITTADCDLYWLKRNDTTWADQETEAKEAAIRLACQFIDRTYRWKGVRKYAYQPMQWPRYVSVVNSAGFHTGLVDTEMLYPGIDTIPTMLKEACCQLALEALSGNLMPSYDQSGRIASETVGPISVSYFANAPTTKKYPMVDLLVEPLHDGKVFGGVGGEAVRG
jgi:hypothetical protein